MASALPRVTRFGARGGLVEACPRTLDDPRWYAESVHVGDLSVLALALRRGSQPPQRP